MRLNTAKENCTTLGYFMELYDTLLESGNKAPSITEDSFGTADKNGYGQLIYPNDLFSSSGDYANSFTAFFMSFKAGTKLDEINETAVSKNTALNNYTTLGSGTISSLNSITGGNKDKEAKLSGALAGGAVGTFIGSIIGEIPTKSLVGTLVKGGFEGGAIWYGSKKAGEGEAKTGVLGICTDRVTQKACICLPTPAIVTNYDIEWSEESNKFLGGLLAAGASFSDLFNKETTDAEKLAKNLVTSAGAAVTAMALSTPMFGSTLGLLGQQAANPRKEQIFKGVGMREFSFTYLFAPRSESEAKNVESIIQMFKYHAHPTDKKTKQDATMSGFLLNYPSEFDIIHYHTDSNGNSTRNTHLPKIATSVLKRVSVDYAGGNDNYTFFENGMPSIIKLDLTFVEIAMLTGDDIAVKGF